MADALARPRAKRQGAAAALITELPSDVDQALVANGYRQSSGRHPSKPSCTGSRCWPGRY
jgi:hypothetical protein